MIDLNVSSYHQICKDVSFNINIQIGRKAKSRKQMKRMSIGLICFITLYLISFYNIWITCYTIILIIKLFE